MIQTNHKKKARWEDIYAADPSSRNSRDEEEDLDPDEDDEDFVDSYDYGNDLDDNDDPVEELEEESELLFNQLVYGTSHGQAVGQYFARADDREELFYQDGTPFEVVEEAYYGWSSSSAAPTAPSQRQSPLSPSSTTQGSGSWVDDLLLQDDSTSSSSSSWFTDEDVRQALDLAGGRAQLRTILLEGALAREKLISSNFKLVMSIARKWSGESGSLGGSAYSNKESKTSSLVHVYSSSTSNRPTLDEALQEGVLGLAEAADRFDPDLNLRFSTYATFWVTNYIRRAFYRESSQGIRLPDMFYEIKRKYINRVRYYRSLPGGDVPSVQVLADDLGVSEKRLTNVIRMTRPLLSLESSAPNAGQGSSGAGKAGISGSTTNSGYTLAALLAR